MRKHLFALLSAILMLFGVNVYVSADDFNSSDYFTNLDFNSCETGTDDTYTWYNPTGWNLYYNDDTNSQSSFNTYEPRAYEDSWMPSNMSGIVLYGWGDSDITIDNNAKLCYQVSTTALPAGTYKVSALISTLQSGISLYAIDGNDATNEITEEVYVSSDQSDATTATTLTITLSTSATLEIGFKTNASLTYSGNFFADDFTVTAVSEDGSDDTVEGSISSDVVRVVGGDISLVPAYEDAGDDWLDASGLSITNNYSDGMITYLRDVAGWNAIRVRLLADPTVDDTEQYDDYLATCQDIDYVKKLGKRIKDAGMYFLLDIFYSDTWTDVNKQWIPSSWNMDKNTATSELATKVQSYTTEVINALVDYGATPDYVQIGNEISYGMLWDSYSGKSKTPNYFILSSSYSAYQTQIDRFATLLTAAAAGVRASEASSAKIVLHSERTINSTYTKNFYDWVTTDAGFTDYDVIGLSYYPAWQGPIANLQATLNTLISAYPSKEIQIVETGYYSTSDVEQYLSDDEKQYCTWGYNASAQANFLSDLTSTLNNYTNVTGLYYWQPEECGNGANSSGTNIVKETYDYRGFWDISWKSENHALISETALMTLQDFNHTALDIAPDNTTTEATDISDTYFDNLDFEDCTWNASGYVDTCPSWTINYDDFTSEKNWPVKKDDYMTSLVSGYVMQTYENAALSSGTKVFYQTSNDQSDSSASTYELPAGTYTVTAVVHADGTGNFALYASDGTNTETSKISDSGSNNWANAATYKVTIELTTASTLEIGIMVTDDIEASTSGVNLYADNFKVTQTLSDDDTSGITEIKAIPTTNAIYNIQGMRVNDTSKKGIYIINGKKVLVR